jgi:hypothetical protein
VLVKWGRAVACVVLAVAAASCSSLKNEPAQWSVRGISSDERTLSVSYDASCGAHVTSTHVDESADRVKVEIAVRTPGGNCAGVLIHRTHAIRLSDPLGSRWIEGACANPCGSGIRKLRCDATGALPFHIGYLPGGWSRAKVPGFVVAYQSSDGAGAIEFTHGQRVNVDMNARVTPIHQCGGWLMVSTDVDGTELGNIESNLF